VPSVNHPNILLCLFDSLSAIDSEALDTKNGFSTLSELYSTGAYFDRAYSPCPESSPARASLFTGLDPCVHGLWTNGVALPANEQTFVQRLTAAGYSSYLAGRYQLAGVSRWTTEAMRHGEYHQMDWAHGPLHRSRQNAYLQWLQSIAYDHYSSIFSSQANPDNTTDTEDQKTALMALPEQFSFNHWVGMRVSEWIDLQSSGQPFVAVAGFSVGDRLGTRPRSVTDGEGLNLLGLKQADVAIGLLMDGLANSNRLDDTVVIVASARGNEDSPNNECALSERAIRVPIVFRGADIEPQKLDGLVSTMDIAPTILNMANVPSGPRVQGTSLLGVLNGSTSTREWGMSRIRKLLPSGERLWQSALCTNDTKLIVSHDLQQNESLRMYNLDADPLEQHNLAVEAANMAILEKLMDQMIDARCALEDRTEPRIAEF